MKRWSTSAASAAMVLCALPAWAAPGLVRTVRCSTAGESVRVVVDLSRAMSYDAQLSADSTALIIEIPGAVSEASLDEVKVEAAGVGSVHTRTLAGGTQDSRVEVTFELEARIAWKHFSLPAERGKPARIVVDIERTGELSPATMVAADSDAVDASPLPTDAAPPVTRTAARARPFVVAIDAGHGGHDTGTIGRYGLTEKKLTLDIAQRIARDLNLRSGIRAVMTRETDVYLTLPQRNEIAEKLGADVFVSIHLNSAPSSSARGAEIYFVAPAGAERAANQEMTSGDAAHDFGLDNRDDADIVHMLLDVNQQAVLARSEALAACILEEVRDRDLLPTRSVKQKSFSVLRTISMPSVLVEAGFVSNSADAKFIRTEDGRNRIAHAVGEGVSEFLRTQPPQRGSDVSGQVVHRVQNGDTLWTISKRYNTTVSRICQLNGFGTSQQLRVGQEIVVSR
jgi:N-acetylmuramoyl-L-alanine amidase